LKDSANGGSNCTATNGCGVHVHSGLSCDASSQGGHLYSGSLDPWTSVRYSTTTSGGEGSWKNHVTVGNVPIDKKAFIVHDNAGQRVACGLLSDVTSASASATLSQLSSSGVTGSVTLFEKSTRLFGAGRAAGLEASLSDDSNGGSDCTATNGCGVHVHDGTGCADKASQGGHLYTGSVDPWTSVRYTSTDASGNSSRFVFSVVPDAKVHGKPFVVHANNGSRVACGLINKKNSELILVGCASWWRRSSAAWLVSALCAYIVWS
jgi:hypothetical protein